MRPGDIVKLFITRVGGEVGGRAHSEIAQVQGFVVEKKICGADVLTHTHTHQLCC